MRLMAAEDSRVVQYTWRTKDCLMGSFFTDPQTDYEAGPSQNRVNSIIFASHPDARIVPVCASNHRTGNKHYRQHVSIQHENVMIIAKNNVSSKHATRSRIYFGKGMKARMRLTNTGWYWLTEGDAYVAIHPAPWQGTDTPAFWLDERYLEMSEDTTPMIFVVSNRTTHPKETDFLAWLNAHEISKTTADAGDALSYLFPDSSGKQIRMTLFRDVRQLPRLNGKIVDLKPPFTFDGPYIQSKRGSDHVHLQFKGETLTLDFS